MIPNSYERCSKCGGYLVVYTREDSTSSNGTGYYEKCIKCGATFRIW